MVCWTLMGGVERWREKGENCAVSNTHVYAYPYRIITVGADNIPLTIGVII